jgi:hypothetical protein
VATVGAVDATVTVTYLIVRYRITVTGTHASSPYTSAKIEAKCVRT